MGEGFGGMDGESEGAQPLERHSEREEQRPAAQPSRAWCEAREVGELSDASFNKNATKRTSTPDLPVDVLDDFLKEGKGSVKCDWPGSFGSINYG